jgi:hypothetical protein
MIHMATGHNLGRRAVKEGWNITTQTHMPVWKMYYSLDYSTHRFCHREGIFVSASSSLDFT